MAKERDSIPAFSRSGNSNPFGKCTEEVKALLPSEAKEQLTALAVIAGQSTSEYVRDLLLEHLYGKLRMVRFQANPHSVQE